jgi:hypothetical protein
MLLYGAATPTDVSAILVVERQAKKSAKQHLVYFVSEVLHDTRSRYPNIQKLLYVVLMSSHKLKHYFLSHKIKVVSSYPLGTIVHTRDAVGRIAQWTVELGQYDIEFVPRSVIKSQALADFVAEWTNPEPEEVAQNPEHWLMSYDGAKCKNGAGARVVLISPEGDAMRYAIQIDFNDLTPTNNIVEYEGLLTGL